MEFYYFFLILSSSIFFTNGERLESEQIVGGETTEAKNFKYLVAIIIIPRQEQPVVQIECSGTIIGDWYITTVAHCFYNQTTKTYRHEEFYVTTSLSDLQKPSNKSLYIMVDLVYLPTYYAGFDTYNTLGNIAVVRLAENLGLRQGHHLLKPLQIPKSLVKRGSEPYTVAGYGWHEINIDIKEEGLTVEYVRTGHSDGKLRYANAEILNVNDCLNAIGTALPLGNMCVKIMQTRFEKKGICQGDSGNPLVHDKFLYGMAINGFLECNENKMPGVYINVPFYYDFIRTVLRNKTAYKMHVIQLRQRSENDYEFVEI